MFDPLSQEALRVTGSSVDGQTLAPVVGVMITGAVGGTIST